MQCPKCDFYPRPLRRGRRFGYEFVPKHLSISIHALFAEGDRGVRYPDPDPDISIHALFAEGDVVFNRRLKQRVEFLSTPSSQRATSDRHANQNRHFGFLSTPSSQRATEAPESLIRQIVRISIHALFAEGDPLIQRFRRSPHIFLSTPSSQRATARCGAPPRCGGISIHALFAEGDHGRGGS